MVMYNFPCFFVFFNNFSVLLGYFVYYGSICGKQLIRGPKCTGNPIGVWMRHFLLHIKICPNGPPINILMQTWDDLDDGEMCGHPMGWLWDGWSSNGMMAKWVVIQWNDGEMGGHPMEWWWDGWSSNGMMARWVVIQWNDGEMVGHPMEWYSYGHDEHVHVIVHGHCMK